MTEPVQTTTVVPDSTPNPRIVMETQAVVNTRAQFSEEINEIAKALAKAQGEMAGAKKSSQNPFFSSKYADLSSVMEACREALVANELAVTQYTLLDTENKPYLATMVMHSSGQWMRSYYPLRVPQVVKKSKDKQTGEIVSEEYTKNDPQTLGSVMTYIRRYQYAAVLGVALEDDDAESAMSNSRQDEGLTATCEIHHTKMRRFVKEDREWWSHKLDDGTWCNGKPAKKE